MGLFEKENTKNTSRERCERCGKKIRRYEKYTIIDGKVYCESCARSKKDWAFLEFLAMIED